MLRRASGNVELDLSVAAISNCYCDRPKVGAVLLVSVFVNVFMDRHERAKWQGKLTILAMQICRRCERLIVIVTRRRHNFVYTEDYALRQQQQ